MNINRRNFLRGALSVTVLPRCQGESQTVGAEDGRQTEFPMLLLELCGKYPGEEGLHVVTHSCARRMVTVDQKLIARGIALALDELPRRYVSREFLTL